ncbi:CoA transferase [Streptomyces sp. NPDC046887]|uniref:CoA transferase n=1 Tax=Streptomyces sp. NPDC046887 TaxID=3155472 RepID=UPI0033D27F02
MASPVTPRIHTDRTACWTGRPLESFRFRPAGPAPIAEVVAEQLRTLGAEIVDDGEAAEGGQGLLSGGGFDPVAVQTAWAAPGTGLVDEATVQAATGIVAVHGRRDGAPRGLAADYTATATGLLTVQGVLAALVGQARGGSVRRVATRADLAGLLTVSQYLAAAGAEEGEAAELAPGGPPFTSAEGTVFELETLDGAVWARFWRTLGAPEEAVRAGWRPFQFRYATACAPFPAELHATTARHTLAAVVQAAAEAGADVCRLRTLAERAAEHDGQPPLRLSPLDAGRLPRLRVPSGGTFGGARGDVPGSPLAGLTVLEAGRRIQAPLAAHLLGLLGAEVIRIEPPGGDPLRGMPPTCSGISARWLALNRGKAAVEIDIKSPADRERLRELAAGADVFLHNWAPGTAARLGLDSGDLAGANPALVYAYTGGWDGRIDGAPMGTDFMVQARTGVGEAVRPEGEPPAPSLMTLLDVLGGLLGAQAVLAGLLLRERYGNGVGVRVDSSLLGAADLLTGPALRRVARGGSPRRPAGFRAPLRTADGWIAPADASAPAARAHDLTGLATGDALALLGARGLAATRVTTDLAELPAPSGDGPHGAGAVGRDALGAPAVPAPWAFG